MVCLYFACLRKHRLGDMVIFLINLCPETSKSQDQTERLEDVDDVI